MTAPLRSLVRQPATWVFLILFCSYCFFWHSRDWNTASRLMLTYALVDRGTIVLTGLQQQTGDIALFQGQYYTDKAPGFSLLATPSYAIAKWLFGLPSHPLNRPPILFWDADYWVTISTSSFLTAVTAVLLVISAQDLGCSPRRASFIGLAYGLATPAYAYATLAYGHQPSAFALFASFFLLWKSQRSRNVLRYFVAGVLASYAAVIDLTVGPASAVLAFYLLVSVVRKECRSDAIVLFGLGALIPAVVLLTYNQFAFGSFLDMGYFHLVTREFAGVHSADHPLGLAFPTQFWKKLVSLLCGRYRGLGFYAPILVLSLPGWVVLFARRCLDVAAVTLLVVVSALAVNLFYPAWTGGWGTGPRMLVPAIPFAMLPVAALLAGNSRWATAATIIAVILALAGGMLMLLCQSVGGRLPVEYEDPIFQTVWPICRGQFPLTYWRYGERFTRNFAAAIAPGWIGRLPPSWQFLQFLPLVLAQAAAILGLCVLTKDARDDREDRSEADRARHGRTASRPLNLKARDATM